MWGRGSPGETNSVMEGQGMREDEASSNNSEQSQDVGEILNPASEVARGGHDPPGT